MWNVKRILPRALVVGMLAALGAASHAAAGELGVLAGSGNGYHSLALSYQTAPVWQGEFVAHPLDLSLEYSLGQVRAPTGQSNRDLLRLGVTPFARWWFSANSGIELGVGANVFSGTRVGGKDISTALQFGSSIGVLHRLRNTPWLIRQQQLDALRQRKGELEGRAAELLGQRDLQARELKAMRQRLEAAAPRRASSARAAPRSPVKSKASKPVP